MELGSKTHYRCRYCDSPLALTDDILSRSFSCRRGRAFLFNNVVNVTVGPQEERMMISGMHVVEDVFCCCCGQIIGWKYIAAHEKSQKYKEGKFVLERWRITEVAEGFNLDGQSGSSDADTP